MIKLSSKQTEHLTQYERLAAQRSETIQQINSSRTDADAFASRLDAQRTSGDSGASAAEKLRRATAKFDQAEQRCQELALVLQDLNEKIVALHDPVDRDLKTVREQLMKEALVQYNVAAEVFQSVCRQFVAFHNQLGLPLPVALETNLKIPVLGKPGDSDISATYALMPPEREGTSWFNKPVWDSVAQKQVDELKSFVDIAAKIAAEARVSRLEKQEAAIAKKQQLSRDEQSDPYRNARHL